MTTTDPHRTFHPLRVTRIIRETADARSLVFEIPPALAHVFRYQAGQFLTLAVPWEGVTLKRCYSLASSPDCESEHKVTVKRVDGGRVSGWINATLREGDTLQVLPPEGRFVLTQDTSALTLFAGGSGITPVISILKTALATTARAVRLLYANRDAASVIFRAELDEWQRRHADRLRVVHRLDDAEGYVTAALARDFLARDTGGHVYLCGPTPFMDAVERGALDAGVAPARLHIERFVSAPDPRPAVAPAPAPAAATTPAFIDVEFDGKKHRVPYARGQTILQAAKAAGLDPPHSCEEGYCGTCTSRLLAGEVRMDVCDALGPAEKARGLILTCQARPVSSECAVIDAA